jgi:2-polyprenyl-3-methyl-5-hydroxy-6-metoxy-1,4-benzoquinol methylase
MAVAGPWNINIHYDALLDSRVPLGTERVLDVGTGDGFLAARLARRVPTVMAVDIDGPVLERARARFPEASVTWLHRDVMDAEFAPALFDAVVSNAALHHLDDTPAALQRLGSLLRPGGTLAVVTFARSSIRELPWHAAAWIFRGIAQRIRGDWEHSAPVVWPPKDSLRQLRQHAQTHLPGSRVQRLPYGRVLITWSRSGPR